MPTRLALDVDTGTDDAIAIMLAILHPDLELVACTTCFGNTAVENCTENTLRVLERIGRPDVPVFEGAAGPLGSAGTIPAVDSRSSAIHGALLDLPPAKAVKQEGSAADFLREAYGRPGSDMVLVAVGPLTNLAEALAARPQIAANIPRLVIMGGGHAISNSTPSAEHNIWADPEAAAAVFAAGIPRIELVTLDATHMALFSGADCARLAAMPHPAGEAAAAMIGQRIAGYDETQPMATEGTAPVHDALCVAMLADPGLVTLLHRHVAVEVSGELTRGRTVIDLQQRGQQAPNCSVALSADGPAFVDFVLETFEAAPASLSSYPTNPR